MSGSWASASGRRLVVAIHDVTPAHNERLEILYRLLDDLDVGQFALFVVPDWHGEWPLTDHPAFLTRLRTLARQGAEIVLHGYRHDEMGSRRGRVDHVRAFGRTAREAEFLSLAPDEATRRIRKGLEMLRRSGLEPIGFVPPAWLSRRELHTVASRFGFAFTEDDRHVYWLTENRRTRAPVIRWSTRRRWRATAGVAIAACRIPLERRYRVRRVALHPTDFDVAAVAKSCRRTLAALMAERRVSAYRELAALPDVVA